MFSMYGRIRPSDEVVGADRLLEALSSGASGYDLTIRSWPRAFGSEIFPVSDRGRSRVEQVISLL